MGSTQLKTITDKLDPCPKYQGNKKNKTSSDNHHLALLGGSSQLVSG